MLCVLGMGQARHGPLLTVSAKVVASAKAQLSWGTLYDGRYVKLKYPGGDLPKNRGVCTDVVIRAFRAAGFDLQKLVHEDMKAAWSRYPRYTGLTTTDSNIDHRRVKNLRVFFARHGKSLSKDASKLSEWKPGDVVTWRLDSGLDHIGVLVDVKGRNGHWEVVHNLSTTTQENCLTTWTITGHYRYKT